MNFGGHYSTQYTQEQQRWMTQRTSRTTAVVPLRMCPKSVQLPSTTSDQRPLSCLCIQAPTLLWDSHISFFANLPPLERYLQASINPVKLFLKVYMYKNRLNPIEQKILNVHKFIFLKQLGCSVAHTPSSTDPASSFQKLNSAHTCPCSKATL